MRAAEAGEFRRGWLVLIGCFIGMGVSTVSLMGYSAGVFIQPLSGEFGWARAELGAAALIGNVIVMVAAPFAGRFVDRHGLRRTAPLSMLLYAGCVVLLSRMQGDILTFLVLGGLMALVGIASTPLAFTRAITAYFVRRRGLALGLGLTSTGLAGVLAPALLTPFVAEHGWRAGYLALAAIVAAAAPVVWLLVRDAPAPDGHSISPGDRPAVGATLREASRTRLFWTMGGMFLLSALAVSGLVVSFIPMLLDRGSTPAAAGALAALIGAAVMAGRLLTGILLDRAPAAYVAAGVFGVAALALVIFGLAGPPAAALAAIGLGLAMGAEVDLIGFLTARHFGLANYGAIFGSQYSFFILGAGLSPIAAGRIYDLTGGYSLAIPVSAALLAFAAVMALGLRPVPPIRKEGA